MTDSYKSYVIRGFDKHNKPVYIFDAKRREEDEGYSFCYVAKLYQAQRFSRLIAEDFMKTSKYRCKSYNPKIVPIKITLEELEDEIIEV